MMMVVVAAVVVVLVMMTLQQCVSLPQPLPYHCIIINPPPLPKSLAGAAACLRCVASTQAVKASKKDLSNRHQAVDLQML